METLIIKVDKRRGEGPPQLGITVEASPSHQGLQITQIQSGSVIDSTGKFKIGDIIFEANDVSLQGPFAEAQKTLKKLVLEHDGALVLKVLRKTSFSRHLVGALNTRRIGVLHRIRLKKGPGGFGIKIAERDNMLNNKNRPIYITAITTTGSAYQDGQLREGDMLVELNGIDLHGKSQPEVSSILKEIKTDEEVEIVVSRQENNVVDSRNDIEKESTHVYDIPLNDTKSAGLGLYLKYPRRSSDGKDLGVWIEKVITGGAAWKDGRLQPNDQIVGVNGISLVDLSNAEASETLTAAVCRGIGPEATANTIKLHIQRRDPAVAAKILSQSTQSIKSSDSDSSIAISPQTQASSSLRSSSTDKQNISSQKTTNTNVTEDNVSTSQSSDESLDPNTSAFERDGFGRQSISEKRHTQLMMSTEKFRMHRSRDEREAEQELHEQKYLLQQNAAAMRSAYQIYGGISNPGFDHSLLKRSNSLESIQHNPVNPATVVPRVGTVRIARNRRLNESFRAAVDRSYETSANESQVGHRYLEMSVDNRTIHVGTTRMTSSIANSTTSTANEEKTLINQKSVGEGLSQTHKKSSSLLTKLIKFGSMKKKRDKARNGKSSETKEASNERPVRNGESSIVDKDYYPMTTGSHTSNKAHSRNLSNQSHVNTNPENRLSLCHYQQPITQNNTQYLQNPQHIANHMTAQQLNGHHHHHHHHHAHPQVPSQFSHMPIHSHGVQSNQQIPAGCMVDNISHQWQQQQQPQPTNGLWVTTSTASNGLWVTNPTVTNHNQQAQTQSIYGTLPHQPKIPVFPLVTLDNNYPMGPSQQLPSNMMPPIAPQIVGAPPQRVHNHQEFQNTGGPNGLNQHYNMQPQHIYYYDF